MSIDYQDRGDAMSLANQMQEEYNLGGENPDLVYEADFSEVDTETGEVKDNG